MSEGYLQRAPPRPHGAAGVAAAVSGFAALWSRASLVRRLRFPPTSVGK